MKIILNGEQKEFSAGITVEALLDKLGIQKEHVAVEINLHIVPKSRFSEAILENGDILEIVSFVGGGA